jgi:hypothetical protein
MARSNSWSWGSKLHLVGCSHPANYPEVRWWVCVCVQVVCVHVWRARNVVEMVSGLRACMACEECCGDGGQHEFSASSLIGVHSWHDTDWQNCSPINVLGSQHTHADCVHRLSDAQVFACIAQCNSIQCVCSSESEHSKSCAQEGTCFNLAPQNMFPLPCTCPVKSSPPFQADLHLKSKNMV